MDPGSPAALAGLKEGDSLVNIGEELVIFLETGEVEELLQREQTELKITIERFHSKKFLCSNSLIFGVQGLN